MTLGEILSTYKPTPITALLKGAVTLNPGLCYIDGVNGVKNSLVDGTMRGKDLFWYDGPVIAHLATDPDKKIDVYPLDGLQVVGQGDKITTVNQECKPSETASHEGQLEPLTIRTDTVANNQTDNGKFCAIYRGHLLEVKEGKTPTDSADAETDLVYDLRSGN